MRVMMPVAIRSSPVAVTGPNGKDTSSCKEVRWKDTDGGGVRDRLKFFRQPLSIGWSRDTSIHVDGCGVG